MTWDNSALVFSFPFLIVTVDFTPFTVGFFPWELRRGFGCGVAQSRSSVSASGLDVLHDCWKLGGSDSAEGPSQSLLPRCSWTHCPTMSR